MTILSRRSSNSSSEIIVSSSGATGSRVITASCTTVCMVNGANRMSFTTSKLLPRSASDWMSALPSSGSSARRAAAQPLVVELPRVTLRQGAVLAQALALGRRELRTEHQQRPEDGEHQHGHQPDDLHLEFGQLGAGVKDPVGDRPGEQRALGQQHRRERVAHRAEKAQAAAAVRMRRHETSDRCATPATGSAPR